MPAIAKYALNHVASRALMPGIFVSTTCTKIRVKGLVAAGHEFLTMRKPKNHTDDVKPVVEVIDLKL